MTELKWRFAGLRSVDEINRPENCAALTRKKYQLVDADDKNYYDVVQVEYIFEDGDEMTRYEVYTNDDLSRYLPEIYCESTWTREAEIQQFKIQTASFGSLDLNEYDEFLELVTVAKTAAQMMTDKFMNN